MKPAKLITHRIRKILAEGPATSREIAAELNIPVRQATVGLWVLRSMGKAAPIGSVPAEGKGVAARLYALVNQEPS